MLTPSPLVPAQYGYEGRVPLKSARLFYDISEKARRIVESYFMLNSTLYFSYTHLVCRTALSGEPQGWQQAGWEGLRPPWGGDGVLRGDTSQGVSLYCPVLELVPKGWAKSPFPQLQRVGIAVPDSSLLGCLLLFVSPTLPLFSSLLFPPLTVPSPFHSPSSPSLPPAVMNKPSCADLTPQIWLFPPQHFLSSSHL